jgi:hypothetical protein
MRAVLILVGAAGLAHADGATMKQGAGGVFPVDNHDVQMVEESIEIAGEHEHLLADDSRLGVTVTYVFANRTDKKIDLQMGFPIAWDISGFYNQGDHCLDRQVSSAVSDFTVTIDGQSVEAVQKKGRKPGKTGCLDDDTAERVRQQDENSKGPWYHEYFVWPVSFAPKQQHTIVNKYHYNASTASRAGDWNQFEYVLKTGALWRKNIEKVSIVAHFGDRARLTESEPYEPELKNFDDDPFSFGNPEIKATPAGAHARRLADGTTEIYWQLRNYKPDENISFAYLTAAKARQAVREAISKLDLKKTPRPTLERARDTLHALYGRKFDDDKLAKRFSHKSWYIVDDNWQKAAATDKLLAAIEERLK